MEDLSAQSLPSESGKATYSEAAQALGKLKQGQPGQSRRLRDPSPLGAALNIEFASL
jgi:hypothetical protein